MSIDPPVNGDPPQFVPPDDTSSSAIQPVPTTPDAAALDQAVAELVGVKVGFRDYIDETKKAHASWKSNEHLSSNKARYAVVARCLRINELVEEDSADGKRLRTEAEEYIKKAGLKFQADTHMTAKIARIVYSDDRKLSNAISQVLRDAVANGIRSEGLVEYITRRGGTEAIRTKKAKRKSAALKDRAQAAHATLRLTELGVASDERLRAAIDRAEIGAPALLLATRHSDGDFTIHAVVVSKTIVNKAFVDYQAEASNGQPDAAAEQQAATQQQLLAGARAAAARAALTF